LGLSLALPLFVALSALRAGLSRCLWANEPILALPAAETP